MPKKQVIGTQVMVLYIRSTKFIHGLRAKNKENSPSNISPLMGDQYHKPEMLGDDVFLDFLEKVSWLGWQPMPLPRQAMQPVILCHGFRRAAAPHCESIPTRFVNLRSVITAQPGENFCLVPTES
jgi:hypothetical protein